VPADSYIVPIRINDEKASVKKCMYVLTEKKEFPLTPPEYATALFCILFLSSIIKIERLLFSRL